MYISNAMQSLKNGVEFTATSCKLMLGKFYGKKHSKSHVDDTPRISFYNDVAGISLGADNCYSGFINPISKERCQEKQQSGKKVKSSFPDLEQTAKIVVELMKKKNHVYINLPIRFLFYVQDNRLCCAMFKHNLKTSSEVTDILLFSSRLLWSVKKALEKKDTDMGNIYFTMKVSNPKCAQNSK